MKQDYLKYLTRFGLLAVALFAIGFSINAYSQSKAELRQQKSQLKIAKANVASLKTKKPTQKQVTTDYQKAKDVTQQYLDASNQAHDADKPSSKQYKQAMRKMENSASNSANVTGPLVSSEIKDWYGEVAYGGEDSSGSITMAIRYYNDNHDLMQTFLLSYNVQSGKLSGFSSYMTKNGADESQSILTRQPSMGGDEHA